MAMSRLRCSASSAVSGAAGIKPVHSVALWVFSMSKKGSSECLSIGMPPLCYGVSMPTLGPMKTPGARMAAGHPLVA